ncbi:MAG: hypothetical protein JWM59_2515 [Verrucomicrobiales bacterium]|nr:hypothetical protein [Verrucomicrobiales bacterium]
MRLISVRLRCFRIHQDTGVLHFDAGRTLIAGPNEAGKSTLAEAVHRALFLKAKGATAEHRAMQPALGGVPEVDLSFAARGKVWNLRKRFAGNGTASLTTQGEAALSGEEAEAALAGLLGVEAGLSGRAAVAQWPHLWAWQGQSGDDPTPHATTQHGGLLQRLQDSGGAAAMLSELDGRLAARFATAWAEIFNLNKKPKAGSEVGRAAIALEEAQARRDAALRKSESLHQTVRDYESATAILTELAGSLESLHRQHREALARQDQIMALRQREAACQGPAADAASRLAAMEAAEILISRRREELKRLETSLSPGQARGQSLEEARALAAARAAEAASRHEAAAAARETARQRRDLAEAWTAQLGAAARLQELSAAMSQMEARGAELANLRQEAAALPDVDAARLNRIQQLDAAQASARAALRAMATTLEVLAADGPVEAGGSVMPAGSRRILTEDTEIYYGPSLRLRLRPGGGTSLEEARRKCAEADASLRGELSVCGLATVEEASLAAARRAELATRIRAAEAGLEGMGRSVSPKTLSAAREAHLTAQAEVSRRSAWLPDVALPAEPDGAMAFLQLARQGMEEAETAFLTARGVRDAAAGSLEEASKLLADHAAVQQTRNRELSDLQAQLRLLLDQHGADEARKEALSRVRLESQAAAESLEECRVGLAKLQPHLVTGDLERLTRALDQAAARKNEAETRRAVALNGLCSDGVEDPAAELAMAEAQVEELREKLLSVQRHAGAVSLLHGLFTEEQQALADQFTQPLADRISGYLECLFGPGSRASLALEDRRFTGLHLASRPGQDMGAFSFASLSGGTREQLAAAVRLAVAEILAADHDGCLPLVFDDAFTHSDPDRMLPLQRMLDLAAGRGLQIIVLTCHPAAYAGLGASTIHLVSNVIN